MSVDRMGTIRRSHRDKQRARWPEDAWAEVTRLRVSLDQASQIMDDLRQQHRGAVEAIEYHVANLKSLWRGGVVRDLAESEAGYNAAIDRLRGR